MPLFRFQAVHSGGQKTEGIIEADSLSVAKDRLRAQQMLITEVIPYAQIKKNLTIPSHELLTVTRIMNQLLHASIPLYDAALIVAEKYQKASFHPLLLDICDRLKKGETFSSILLLHPTIFDAVYVGMVKAGENSGRLETAFEELSALLEHKKWLKKKLLAALTYPLFLSAFCLLVFLSLLIWIIPSLKNLFAGQTLHPLTHAIFSLSDLVLNSPASICLPLFFLLAFVFLSFFHPPLRAYKDRILLKTPLLGSLIQLAATTRFCRTCSLLLKGGQPLPQALHCSRSLLKNLTLQQAAALSERKITEGHRLSAHVSWMAPCASRMLSIGEKTGNLSLMFFHIATLCEEDLTRSLEKATSLLQPILLLILGLLIGTVVLSILIPLTDVGAVL